MTVRPCRYQSVGALRRFLPASSPPSFTNETANGLRAAGSSTLAVNRTLCSSVPETSRCPLRAVTERVHCPAPAVAAAAADPSCEQTDRPPVRLPPLRPSLFLLLHHPLSSHHISLLRPVFSIPFQRLTVSSPSVTGSH